MVKNWYKKTPDNFRFTAKFPKSITHDKRLIGVHKKELEYFFKSISGLDNKILALLIQLPPSLKITEGIEGLKQIIPELDKRFRYAVEVRDRSWFQDLAYNFFANNKLCMVWSQLAEIKTPAIVTTDFLYLRLIGDRNIHEKDFGKIQKDRIAEMKKWAKKLKRVVNEEVVKKEEEQEKGCGGRNPKLAIVSANNHYAGFGPGTANIFRKMIGLPEAPWKEEDKSEHLVADSNNKIHRNSEKQSTLSDFMK
jgi:uncharacterized protein YecE (DUF72 family)